jgi:hypothetical protein
VATRRQVAVTFGLLRREARSEFRTQGAAPTRVVTLGTSLSRSSVARKPGLKELARPPDRRLPRRVTVRGMTKVAFVAAYLAGELAGSYVDARAFAFSSG